MTTLNCKAIQMNGHSDNVTFDLEGATGALKLLQEMRPHLNRLRTGRLKRPREVELRLVICPLLPAQPVTV